MVGDIPVGMLADAARDDGVLVASLPLTDECGAALRARSRR